jgi:hypothetical protein
MFIEDIVNTYGNDPEFQSDLQGFVKDGEYSNNGSCVNDAGEQGRDAIIAAQIFAQRERQAYFNKFILPFTSWGQTTVQASFGSLPGDALSYTVTRDSQVCSQNLFNTYRPTEAVACYTGCIHKCSCHDYDSAE